MSGPTIRNLRLPPCCRRALRNIGEIQELARSLRIFVAASPFLVLLGSNPPEVIAVA